VRVAITGSHGFIGAALVSSRERDGEEVVRVSRDASGTLDADALYGTDVVVHLAGEGVASKRWTPEQKHKVLDSRTIGTTLVAETIAKMERKPRVLLSASAVGYYGSRGDEVLTEASAAGSDFLAEVCAKWEASTAAADGDGEAGSGGADPAPGAERERDQHERERRRHQDAGDPRHVPPHARVPPVLRRLVVDEERGEERAA